MTLTEMAYEYAKRMKKVNQGVIEAYKDGYNRGYKNGIKQSDENLISELKSRYRNKRDVDYDLGMSDARRGPNEKEAQEVRIRSLIEKFETDLKELK